MNAGTEGQTEIHINIAPQYAKLSQLIAFKAYWITVNAKMSSTNFT